MTEDSGIPFTRDGTDSMDQQELPCQPNVLIQCDVGPRPLVGYRENIQDCTRGWLAELCVITGRITAATSKTKFRSKTVKVTMSTSLRNHRHINYAIVVTERVSTRNEHSL